MPDDWLATLEATIAKLPNRDKTPIQTKVAIEKIKDDAIEKKLATILASYPQHKAVLGLKFKFDKQAELQPNEQKELEKFYSLLIEKKKP